MQQKVLMIDADTSLTREVCHALIGHHYIPLVAHNGIAGFDEALRVKPSLIVLDILLPQHDGLEVCRKLRAHRATSLIPIIMASAMAEEQDRLAGYEVGADCFLAKPFSIRELLAHIKAISRRSRSNAETAERALRIGDLDIDVSRHTVKVRHVAVHLTVMEFAILHQLALEPGRVFSRDKLLTALGGNDCMTQEHTLDGHIHAIRKKIEPVPARPRYIQTVRGIGFKLADTPASEQRAWPSIHDKQLCSGGS